MIRKAQLSDLEFGLGLCRRLYPNRPVHLAVPWIVDCLRRPQDRLVLISGHGVGVSSLVWKYGFDLIGHLDILAVEPGHPWETMKFLRAMVDWSRTNGARRFSMGSDTGVDLGPLAKRLGGKANPSYHIALEAPDGRRS